MGGGLRDRGDTARALRAFSHAVDFLSERGSFAGYVPIFQGGQTQGHGLRVGAARRELGGGPDPATPGAATSGDAEAAFFLAVAFPASQLRILPYNRVVHDFAGRSPEEFAALVQQQYEWHAADAAVPPRKGEVNVYLQGRWHTLVLPAASASGAVASLDAERLQRAVLEPLLGIGDPRTDKRIDFVGGSRGTAALEHRVDSGHAAVAFSLYPVAMEELMAVSDAGQLMPPKSTWFEPKLRDGLLIHEI